MESPKNVFDEKMKRMEKRLKQCRERKELMLEKDALVAFKPYIKYREMTAEKKEFETLLQSNANLFFEEFWKGGGMKEFLQ